MSTKPKRWHLFNEYNAALACKGSTFLWSRNEPELVTFTRENTGRERADDFHVNALKWAKKNSTSLTMKPTRQ